MVLLRQKTRRALIVQATSWISLAAAGPGRARASQSARALQFENLHTGDRLKTTYWSEGAYVPEALREIAWVLRDHRTDTAHPIAPGLLDLLVDVRAALESTSPLHVISGYRAPESNAQLARPGSGVARRSLHMEGSAVDIRIPGIALTRLRDAAKSLRQGGVGYYPDSQFVHLDVGRVRQW